MNAARDNRICDISGIFRRDFRSEFRHVVGVRRCSTCGSKLRGRQREFCSRQCKNADTNKRLQSYVAQQTRGRKRKILLVQMLGGKCTLCGYNSNYSALEFHHRRPAEKEFPLDLRSLSNRSWSVILQESRKCSLVCSNCHNIRTACSASRSARICRVCQLAQRHDSGRDGDHRFKRIKRL